MSRSTAILTLATLLSSGCQECFGVPGLSSPECERLGALRLPDSPPPASGNAFASNQDAAILGHALFFDARLSANQDVRCATCHIPERFFADGLPTSIGLEKVARNSPSLYGAAWHRWQMWDGKADSLWSQPLIAFENEKEMNFTRLELAHRVALTYRGPYEALFGALPLLTDAQRFPARGKPGDPSFDGMTSEDQLAVNRVAANLGKSLEAYQRRLAFKPGRFDAFLEGDETLLTADEREGARVFFEAGCESCHSGPLFSDDRFHALSSTLSERARGEALEVLARSPFNAAGPFHDGAPGEVPVATAQDEGAYRTPSLRNVGRTGPWGHDGAFATLESVVDFHLPPSVTFAERGSLLAFLRALDATDPPSPWNNWPGR